jgi:hypothetical protein
MAVRLHRYVERRRVSAIPYRGYTIGKSGNDGSGARILYQESETLRDDVNRAR